MSTVEYPRAGAGDAPGDWHRKASSAVDHTQFEARSAQPRVSFLSWSAAVSVRKHRGRWSLGCIYAFIHERCFDQRHASTQADRALAVHLAHPWGLFLRSSLIAASIRPCPCQGHRALL